MKFGILGLSLALTILCASECSKLSPQIILAEVEQLDPKALEKISEGSFTSLHFQEVAKSLQKVVEILKSLPIETMVEMDPKTIKKIEEKSDQDLGQNLQKDTLRPAQNSPGNFISKADFELGRKSLENQISANITSLNHTLQSLMANHTASLRSEMGEIFQVIQKNTNFITENVHLVKNLTIGQISNLKFSMIKYVDDQIAKVSSQGNLTTINLGEISQQLIDYKIKRNLNAFLDSYSQEMTAQIDTNLNLLNQWVEANSTNFFSMIHNLKFEVTQEINQIKFRQDQSESTVFFCKNETQNFLKNLEIKFEEKIREIEGDKAKIFKNFWRKKSKPNKNHPTSTAKNSISENSALSNPPNYSSSPPTVTNSSESPVAFKSLQKTLLKKIKRVQKQSFEDFQFVEIQVENMDRYLAQNISTIYSEFELNKINLQDLFSKIKNVRSEIAQNVNETEFWHLKKQIKHFQKYANSTFTTLNGKLDTIELKMGIYDATIHSFNEMRSSSNDQIMAISTAMSELTKLYAIFDQDQKILQEKWMTYQAQILDRLKSMDLHTFQIGWLTRTILCLQGNCNSEFFKESFEFQGGLSAEAIGTEWQKINRKIEGQALEGGGCKKQNLDNGLLGSAKKTEKDKVDGRQIVDLIFGIRDPSDASKLVLAVPHSVVYLKVPRAKVAYIPKGQAHKLATSVLWVDSLSTMVLISGDKPFGRLDELGEIQVDTSGE